METAITREQALETVAGSPRAVAAHDKEGWLALFAELSVVEDPVGSRPHVSGVLDARSGRRGKEALSRFYDTFIAPNRIVFDVDNDVVSGTHVVRDLEIEITMADDVAVRVPMHLVYELCEESGGLEIRHLSAYWELLPMIRQLLSLGRPAWPVSAALGRRMAVNLGPGGTAGFVRGMRTVGRAGKDAVALFVEACNQGDGAALVHLFSEPGAAIEAPFGTPATTPEDLARSGSLRLAARKMLASGAAVSASIDVDHPAGRSRGVGIFEFDRRSRRMHRVRLYWE